MGMVGDAPFTGLSDLGVDMHLGEDFSASGSGSGTDPENERATAEVVEGMDSDDRGLAILGRMLEPTEESRGRQGRWSPSLWPRASRL